MWTSAALYKVPSFAYPQISLTDVVIVSLLAMLRDMNVRHVLMGIVFAFCLPAPLFAAVRINEIAWMGTAENANAEWLELYNPDDTSVDLTSWTLHWALTAMSPRVVTLSGSVAPRSYFLLERTGDATVPSVIADQIYVGALSNSGETMLLKNAAGVEIDRVNGGDEWKISESTVAGNNTTKETAQRGSESWLTAMGTPRTQNAAKSSQSSQESSATNTAVSTQKTASTTKDAVIRASLDDEEATVATISAHDSSVPVSDLKKIKPLLLATPGRERVGITRAPLLFSASSYDEDAKIVKDARYTWSFGDGSTAEGVKVSHSYKYKGDYIVILNSTRNDAEAIGRTTVHILEPHIKVSDAKQGLQGSFIELTNSGMTEVNIGGWQVRTGSAVFIFPRDTLIAAGKSLRLPFEITKLMVDTQPIRLAFADGEELRESAFTPKDTANQKVVPSSTALPLVLSSTQSFTATAHDTAIPIEKFLLEAKLAAIKHKAESLRVAVSEQPEEKRVFALAPPLRLLEGVPVEEFHPQAAPIASVERATISEAAVAPPARRVTTVRKPPGFFSGVGTYLTNLFKR